MGRRTLVLVVAIVLAALAGYSVFTVLDRAQDAAAEGLEFQPVYRANVLLAEGTEGSLLLSQVNANQPPIGLSEENAQFVPQNAITTEEQLQAVLDGQVAAGPISAGQILTSDQWVQITTEIRPLAEVIPEGKQAITIQADAVRGVAGFIEPGDRINVIVTLSLAIDPTFVEDATQFIEGIDETPPDETATEDEVPLEPVEKQITRFVLQGLPVLAVGSEIVPDEDAPETVDATPAEGEEAAAGGNSGLLTLEVTADEAERLVFANEVGTTYYTLVPEDFLVTPTDGVIIETLFEDLGILKVLFPRLQELEDFLQQR